LFLSLYPGVFSSALGGVIAYLSYDAYLAYLEPEIDLLGWLLCSAAYIFGVLLGYILCRREIKFSLSVMKKSRSDILSEA